MSDQYTPREAMKILLQTIAQHSTYPRGNPQQISVTLSDEQWNSVVLALQIVLIANNVKGSRNVPANMLNEMIDASDLIWTTVSDTLGGLATEELLRELEQDL
jgi:hypothetical protein